MQLNRKVISSLLALVLATTMTFIAVSLIGAQAPTPTPTPGPTPTPVIWDLPYGLDEDMWAVNLWTYPNDAVQVTTAGIEDTVPANLAVVWHYSGPAMGWQWFRPGWPEITLDTFDPGSYYIGIVLSASTWVIPQQASTEVTSRSSINQDLGATL